MAITDILPGVHVSIMQNGEPMHEYTESEVAEEERTTTRYIEAQSDKEFQIRLGVAKATKFIGDGLRYEVLVDGTLIGGYILQKDHFRHMDYNWNIEGLETGKGLIRKFRFANLKTTSEKDASKEEAAKVKELGSIVVKVSQKHVVKVTPKRGYNGSLKSIGSISEKSIKGRTLSHSIGLSEAVKSTQGASTTIDVKPVHGVPDPLAVFVFNYRSYDALKSLLIIPRTPSPPPPIPLEERDPATLTLDDIRELQRRHQDSSKDDKTHAKKIKLEHGDDNPRPRKAANSRPSCTFFEIDNDGNLSEVATATATEGELVDLE